MKYKLLRFSLLGIFVMFAGVVSATELQDVTATWNFAANCANLAPKSEGGSYTAAKMASDVKDIEMNIIYNGGSIKNNDNSYQVTTGVEMQIPVKNAGDLITVKGYPGYSKYTIDTSIESPCIADADGVFQGVEGTRRVSDVVVLNKETGEYEPIDPEKTYTLACHNYMLQSMGDGYSMFADNNFLVDSAIADYQVLINYIRDVLQGDLSQYAELEGRITIK